MHKGIEQTVNVKLFEHLLCVVFFFFHNRVDRNDRRFRKKGRISKDFHASESGLPYITLS